MNDQFVDLHIRIAEMNIEGVEEMMKDEDVFSICVDELSICREEYTNCNKKRTCLSCFFMTEINLFIESKLPNSRL